MGKRFTRKDKEEYILKYCTTHNFCTLDEKIPCPLYYKNNCYPKDMTNKELNEAYNIIKKEKCYE